MLDIKFIRENKDIVALGAKKKHVDFDVEELIKVDDRTRRHGQDRQVRVRRRDDR
jgi:seryl-tRNA synthetase